MVYSSEDLGGHSNLTSKIIYTNTNNKKNNQEGNEGDEENEEGGKKKKKKKRTKKVKSVEDISSSSLSSSSSNNFPVITAEGHFLSLFLCVSVSFLSFFPILISFLFLFSFFVC